MSASENKPETTGADVSPALSPSHPLGGEATGERDAKRRDRSPCTEDVLASLLPAVPPPTRTLGGG